MEFAATISDPGTDDLTITWDFGDGSEAVTTNYNESPTPVDLAQTHVYSQDGTYTATLSVTDSDGGVTESTIEVTVNNTAPIIESMTGDTVINEGDTASFNAVAIDAGNDTLTYTWNFGDGSEPITTPLYQTPTPHTYAQNGVYHVTLTVTDGDGGVTTSDLMITVNNVALTIAPIEPMTGDEGQFVQFNFSFSDPGILDTYTVVWDFGDGERELLTGDRLTVNHTYADNGVYTATLSVTDSDGGVSSQEVTVTVNNLAPLIESITGDTQINEGDTATFNAIASDPGDDELTYTWDFGDGSKPIITPDTQTPISHT